MSDANTLQPDPILARLEALIRELRPHIHPDQEEAITRHTMLVAREAYRLGILDRGGTIPSETRMTILARERFPLPPRKVLREEPDPHVPSHSYRYSPFGGNIVHFLYGLEQPSQCWPQPTPERAALWADLLANPWREEPQ